MPTNEPNGWNEWSRHVLFELQRLNDNIESLKSDLNELKIAMATHAEFIETAKEKDIFSKVESNTKFRENVNKLIWKVVGAMLAAGGGATALVNWLMSLINSSGSP